MRKDKKRFIKHLVNEHQLDVKELKKAHAVFKKDLKSE